MILKELLETSDPAAKRAKLEKTLKSLMSRRNHVEKNSSDTEKKGELKHLDTLIRDVKFDLDDCDLSDKFA